LLKGEDRIEIWTQAGRPLRMGAPAELAVGETARISSAIRSGERAEASARLSYFLDSVVPMISAYSELALAMPGCVAEVTGQVPPVEDAWTAWRAQAAPFPLRDRVEQAIRGQDVETYRRALGAGLPTCAAPLLEAVLGPGRLAIEALQGGRGEEAGTLAESCFAAYREIHDLLALLASAHGAAAMERFGGQAAVESQNRAFTTSTFYEPLWSLAGMLAPDELAAVLADHLRYHMSGEGREGSVRIVEEGDRYRLLLEPCGSGGAMRRRGAGAVVDEPSAFTWGRRGEVPVYCTHCALNEVESVRRFGYPVFAADFDPDPQKPCGWSVFKDGARIPRSYFERLGVETP
jgi:hypothetical protein